MELKICHLYPDILNLYGDRGNIISLTKRLEWRGIDASVTKLPLGSREALSGFDLVFIGSGQELEHRLLLEDLRRGRALEIKAAVEDGVPVLAICSGFQMLGNYIEAPDGSKSDFIGALDMYTVLTKKRMIGNYKFKCGPESGGSVVVGFENHSGMTTLGNSAKPLGKVLAGFGNNVTGTVEGARYKNVFGTYSFGPLLPKNPEFCDFLLLTALERKYGAAELSPLDDSAELAAHDEMCAKY